MPILTNFHTHTVLCDGYNTFTENIEKAISLGFHSLGFSGHAYVPFDGLYSGMTPDAMRIYRVELESLKGKYSDIIAIFTGLENDAAYLHPAGGYDYTIGSVHCIKCGDKYYSVDSLNSVVESAIETEFGGDGFAFAEAYYGAVLDFVSSRRADILGHIDVVRRFNKGGVLHFDECGGRYRDIAVSALEKAVGSGYLIEVSTGSIQKGISDETYPADFLLRRARELGARVIVNSDAHYSDYLNFAFDRAEQKLRDIGFTERWELSRDGFMAVKL